MTENIKKQYADFNELKSHLQAIELHDIKQITFLLDRLTLEEMTYDQLIANIDKYRDQLRTKNDFQDVGRVKGHIRFREKHNGFRYKRGDNNNTVQLVGISNSEVKASSEDGKKEIIEQYLPTKADCEMALKALQKSRKGSSVSKEDLFDWLEQHFQDRGISMKSNWKVITERNLDIWFG